MTITTAMKGALPVPLAGIIWGRDKGLVLAAFYYQYISLPALVRLYNKHGHFDELTLSSLLMENIRRLLGLVHAISKVNTALQFL
ncbi:hypothetical protein BC941DRAFT_44673 [Chlamydoabsidia padenii]|nr:hypothetical protein BC941DRAFT_44673 [Chlamydoabsidia padenii]